MVRSGRAAFSEGRKQYLYNGQYGVKTDRDGLYYMRARYYDQDIKRFINRDVLSGDIGNSQSLNRFCYVQGNSVSLTDPFGLCPDSNVAFKKLCIGAYHLDWNALGHTTLDILGIFLPPADVVNFIWYAKEGNVKMAVASAIAVFCDATAGSKLLLGSSKFGKYQGVVNTVAHLFFGGAGVAIGSDMFMTNYENFVGGLKDGRFDVESLSNMVLGSLIAGCSAKGLWNGIGMAAARGSVKGSAKGNVVPLADWDDLNDITMRQFIQLSGSNGRSPSEWARSWQGTEPYLGVDTYRDITLRRGKIIYRGEPNGTEYFTTRSAIERSERDRVKIFQGLQVLEHETYGYRGNVMGYMVMNDIDAAFGITRANTDYGKGGLPQIFVPNAKWLIDSGILVPVYNIQLK